MKITINNPSSHSRNLLRRAGYAMHQNRKGELSFVKRLEGYEYPRFHVYVNKEVPGTLIEMTIHLDEKKPSYEGHTAHSGQYDGPIVEAEYERLLQAMGV